MDLDEYILKDLKGILERKQHALKRTQEEANELENVKENIKIDIESLKEKIYRIENKKINELY